MVWTARIDGAVSMADVRIEGNNIIFPSEIDRRYKQAALTNDICEGKNHLVLMASTDGKQFSLAVCVEIEGKRYTAEEIGKMLLPSALGAMLTAIDGKKAEGEG